MIFEEINKSKIAVTIDIDWASEYAIEYTLDYFEKNKIPVTVFTTHDSNAIKNRLDNLEVGLHPYFDINSSHGATIERTIEAVLQLPHNIKAYRCHRFVTSNEIQDAMRNAGMRCSSNVCTNLAIINPFFNRFDTLEIPIYMEDGGYLFNRYPLETSFDWKDKLASIGLKTIVIHPMHFVVNTPNWEYMIEIKNRFNRKEWSSLSKADLLKLRNRNRGIATLIEDLIHESLNSETAFTTIGYIMSIALKFQNRKEIFP